MIDGAFKDRLRAGEPLLGAFASIEAATAVEVMAVGGFDFLMLDGEHTTMGPADAAMLVRAAEARATPVLARVAENERPVMARYLDAGVLGTMTPMVGSAADARRAVAAVKYPPQGERGLAGVRVNDFETPPGYTQAANEATLVVVQIETPNGIENADEIIATEGVDVVFLGPSDLSAALGVPGETKHPRVLDTIAALTERIAAVGKAAGTVARTAEDYAHWRSLGMQVFLHSATALLLGATRGFLQGVKAAEANRTSPC